MVKTGGGETIFQSEDRLCLGGVGDLEDVEGLTLAEGPRFGYFVGFFVFTLVPVHGEVPCAVNEDVDEAPMTCEISEVIMQADEVPSVHPFHVPFRDGLVQTEHHAGAGNPIAEAFAIGHDLCPCKSPGKLSVRNEDDLAGHVVFQLFTCRIVAGVVVGAVPLESLPGVIISTPNVGGVEKFQFLF